MEVMNNYKVNENQSLFDVLAHTYGQLDNIVELALTNNISLTDVLIAGQNIELIDTEINFLVKSAINKRNIIPATANKNYKEKRYLGFPLMLPVNL